MVTPDQQIKQLEREIEKLEQRRREVLQQTLGSMQSAEALAQYAARELERLFREPASPARDEQIHKHELRRQAALCSVETLTMLAQMEQGKGTFSSLAGKIELNCLKTQYLTTEYYVTHYQRIAAALERALQADLSAGQPAGTGATAPLGRGPLPGAKPGLPGLPGLPGRSPATGTPGLPPRPGAIPGIPSGGPGVPRPSALPARPGAGGPLANRAPLVRPGTRGLGAGTQEPDNALVLKLQAAVAETDTRVKLGALLNHFRELEGMLKLLRGAEPGTLAMDIAAAATQIKQVAGKVYYLNRAVADLGELAGLVSFEQGPPDPAVKALLAQVVAGAEPNLPSDGNLGSRLKSLFKN